MCREVEWKDRLRKLVMDLRRHSSIPVLMDEIDRELINLLCTKIGMLMEDHATSALTVASLPTGQQKAAIDALAVASTTITNLAAAVQSIAE